MSDGHKMAKSAGNFERVTELADRGLDPLALRYLALTSRYGHKLEYTTRRRRARPRVCDRCGRGSRAWVRRPTTVHGGHRRRCWPARRRRDRSGSRPGVAGHGEVDGTRLAGDVAPLDRAHDPDAPLSSAGRALHDRFVDAVDDDLDLPTALAVVRETLRADLPADERRWLVLDADAVLGLDLHRVWDDVPAASIAAAPQAVLDLVGARTAARDARDFARADALRAEIEAMGWDVVDQASGTEVRPRT